MSNKIEKSRVFDESAQLTSNAMLKEQPYLFNEWDFSKNSVMGLSVYKVTKGSNKKAWWRCLDCDSGYDMVVYNRTGKRKNNCPFCAGKRVNHTNSLASLYPELAKQWNTEKNKELSPHSLAKNSSKKVWWECNKGHEWDAKISHRTSSKSDCPYCSNQKILKGFNDMWTTNPRLANLLLNPEDGFKYMQNSNAKVDWKCEKCTTVARDKDISSVNQCGLNCLICSDGSSLGERIMYSLLSYLEVDFKHETSFVWSEKRRYDFYLYDFNSIIEVHGEQHYTKGFENLGGNTTEETQANDKFKEELAEENGVDRYIVIDSRKYSYKWIMSSIMNSELKDMLNLSEEKLRGFNFDINSSKIVDAWRLWDSGVKTFKEIGAIIKVHESTAKRYLTLGRELKLCSY